MLPLNQIICGDCLEIMKAWPDESVHCVVSSPPYWGLRDYCVDGQYGLEKTPEEYVAKMVEVFKEVKRVLRKDGSLWLNLGDSYGGSGMDLSYSGFTKGPNACDTRPLDCRPATGHIRGKWNKQLMGIPWRLAFALQADGWWWRSSIPWLKRNAMPESCNDRPTTSVEYIFLMTKSAKYFYDSEAVKKEAVPSKNENEKPMRNLRNSDWFFDTWQGLYGDENGLPLAMIVNPEAYPESHFATFPRKLVEPCIKAGTSQKGCCAKCGAPWRRIVENKPMQVRLSPKGVAKQEQGLRTSCTGTMLNNAETKTIGWQPSCQCQAEVKPCVVFDPFMGSGTTAAVAYELGRDYVGCELNPKYLAFNRAEKAKQKYSLIER